MHEEVNLNNHQLSAKTNENQQYERLLKELKSREQEWRQDEKQHADIKLKHSELQLQFSELKNFAHVKETESSKYLKMYNDLHEQYSTLDAAYNSQANALALNSEEGNRKISMLDTKMKELKRAHDKEKDILIQKTEALNRLAKENMELQRTIKTAQDDISRLHKEKEIQLTTAEDVFNKKLEEVLERDRKQKEALRDTTKRLQDCEKLSSQETAALSNIQFFYCL